MKILYDHSVFQFQRYGGISRYFYELITRLSSKEDVDISLFQGFHVNEYDLSDYKQRFESYLGYKCGYNKPAARLYICSIANNFFFSNIYMRSHNSDIYHPTYYMKGLENTGKTKMVITVYDMIHELYPGQFRDSEAIIQAKKRSIRIADVIIAISENTKKDLIEIYRVAENKIKVVYLASSLQPSNYFSIDELSMKYETKSPYMLYIGERNSYKNFKILLESYLDHFSDRFDLVCFGGGKFNDDELKAINSIKSKKKIIQLKGDDKLLASLYKHAFCLVYPSLYEGFGIPLLEAMSMGCPVIASKASSIPEVTGNAGILFDPHSKDELIGAIESLSNESRRNELIKLGFEREKQFSWDKTADETLSIYESIL